MGKKGLDAFFTANRTNLLLGNMSKKLTIRLSNLYLDLHNPRYEEQKSQSEALNTIASDQKEKLLVLSRDIIENGLNPSDLPIVMPNPDRAKGYIVLEGNRRIAALKLIRKPEILTHPGLKKKYLRLHESSKDKVPTSIECLVVDAREEANLWIERKHEGEMNGAGTVRWDNIQKDRFLANKTGKTSKAVQLIDFMKAAASDDADLMEQLQRVSATNLDRFLSTPDVRSEFGLEYGKGEYSSRYPVTEVLKGLKAMVRLFASADFNVRAIYHKEDRMQFMHNIPACELPDKQTRTITSWSLKKYPTDNAQSGSQQSSPQTTPAVQNAAMVSAVSISSSTYMRPTTRDTFIPKDLTLVIHNERINRLFCELKQLSHKIYPNVCAVLLRVFLELSLDTFIDTFMPVQGDAVSSAKSGKKFKEKVNPVIQKMTEMSFLDAALAKGIRTELNQNHTPLGVDTLNAYVHNNQFNPIPETLMLSWDNIQPFIIALWKAINQHNSEQ